MIYESLKRLKKYDHIIYTYIYATFLFCVSCANNVCIWKQIAKNLLRNYCSEASASQNIHKMIICKQKL